VNLEPLRAALRAEAEAEARRRSADVDEECARRLADAESRARELIRGARLEGEQAAAKESVRRRAAATRHARELRLSAQRRVIDEFGARARREALSMPGDPRYPSLLARLSRAAKDQLGADAELKLDPPGAGGVRAHAGTRFVDYTLPALVDRAIDDLDGRLRELWQ
jgi:vacuolar-type H+-ATPase subunit E/Vma4